MASPGIASFGDFAAPGQGGGGDGGGILTKEAAQQVFNQVKARKDSTGRSPCMMRAIHGKCEDAKCPYSNEKGPNGKLALTLSPHERTCCQFILKNKVTAAVAKAKANAKAQPGPKSNPNKDNKDKAKKEQRDRDYAAAAENKKRKEE